MPQSTFIIFAVSDATGGLAHSLAVAASRQFEGIQVKIIRKVRVKTPAEIKKVVEAAKGERGVILFTMVSQEVRRRLLTEAKGQEVVAMDVMGPVLDMLSNYFHQLPSDEPGLQYRVTQDYYRRTESAEFTVRHDEGIGLDSIDHADIVFLGVSRTSKTPLSIYLAYQGYRCANIPIVVGQPLPPEIYKLDRKRLVGLLPSPEGLEAHRTSRLKNLGRQSSERYAQKEHIEKELEYSRKIFEELSGMVVVEVDGKAIEEIASEIIHELSIKGM